MMLPDAPWQHRPGMERLLKALGAEAGETRWVGGCVRDTLLGLEVSDVDLATRIAPEQVIARLEKARIKAVPTGLAHGTITAVVAGAPVEITTLRRDVATDGRRATIAYTEDWREDAARRDFTINALSADPASGQVFDYFDGLADLEAGRIRFIGDALQRIAEDHLRILRFFRFHARFGKGAPDAAALEACQARANDLMALSRERIADELLKLLGLPDPAPTVELMIERGIFRPVLPEIEQAARLRALIDAEKAAGIAPAAIRRLAALLPADADVAARLRLSNRLARRLALAAETGLDDPAALAYRLGPNAAIDRLLLGGKSGDEVKALESWKRPHMPVRGGDLIAMGLVAGPVVARVLHAIEEEWLRAGCPADKAEVRAIARRHVDQALLSSQ